MDKTSPYFRDVTIKRGYLNAHIKLSVFGPRFQQAQKWLDKRIMKRMEPYVPRKTGVFLGKIKKANRASAGTGKITTAVPPQGKRLYPGVTETGKPFNWTNPNTQPYWGRYTYREHREEFNKGVKKILLGGKVHE